MKQIEQDKLCYTCYGCGRLEQDNFNGVYRCDNYIKGVRYDEKESIKRYNQGDALFVCGSRRMQINVVVSEEELESFGSGGGF